MMSCATIASGDRRFRAAMEHPKSTPVVEPRLLQQLAAIFRRQAAELRSRWAELPVEDHNWWVAWANDTLPKPSRSAHVLGALFVGFTVINIIIHRNDAVELLTAAGDLRQTVIDLRSQEVWDAANQDDAFIHASELGFADIAQGRVTVVAPKDL